LRQLLSNIWRSLSRCLTNSIVHFFKSFDFHPGRDRSDKTRDWASMSRSLAAAGSRLESMSRSGLGRSCERGENGGNETIGAHHLDNSIICMALTAMRSSDIELSLGGASPLIAPRRLRLTRAPRLVIIAGMKGPRSAGGMAERPDLMLSTNLRKEDRINPAWNEFKNPDFDCS
jgi:hypothetical protein